MNEEEDVVPDPGLRDLAADTAGLFDPALLADIPLLQILKAVMQLPLRNNCARKEGWHAEGDQSPRERGGERDSHENQSNLQV